MFGYFTIRFVYFIWFPFPVDQRKIVLWGQGNAGMNLQLYSSIKDDKIELR